MRRLFVLLVVFGMLAAMPMATATAQDDRFEVDIHAYASRVGANADGCDVSTGGFEVLFAGEVVETGQLRLTSCPNEDSSLVRYTVRYRDASTGNIVNTVGKGVLEDADFDAGVLTYGLTEEIRSSTDGSGGHAEGGGVVTVTDTGFDVVWWNHWIINP